jgi:hypothetical protein
MARMPIDSVTTAEPIHQHPKSGRDNIEVDQFQAGLGEEIGRSRRIAIVGFGLV